jgi:hypothetical protein
MLNILDFMIPSRVLHPWMARARARAFGPRSKAQHFLHGIRRQFLRIVIDRAHPARRGQSGVIPSIVCNEVGEQAPGRRSCSRACKDDVGAIRSRTPVALARDSNEVVQYSILIRVVDDFVAEYVRLRKRYKRFLDFIHICDAVATALVGSGPAQEG